MASRFEDFERVARNAHKFTQRETLADGQLHPFDQRNIDPALPKKVRRLFDDGHFADATFTAFKFIDKLVQKHSAISESGWKLMMAAFDEAGPKIKLTLMSNISETDEQKGYRHIFAGSVTAIRNPRGHEVAIEDDIDTCLDHLSFVSLLLRRLRQSGFSS